MSLLKFLDKRSEDKSLLRFEVPKLNYIISENIFNSITNYKSYKILEKNLSQEYLKMYFKKKFYQETTNLASKVLINRWNFKHDKKNFLGKLSLENTPYFHILKKIFENENFLLINEKKLRISDLIKSNKWFFYFYFFKIKNSFFRPFKKKISKKNEIKIGVNYIEGHDSKYRNDLFWLQKNKIKNHSIVYYCESKEKLKKFSVDNNELNNFGYNFVKIWKWNNIKKIDFIEKVKKQIDSLNAKDDFEKWLIREIKIFLIQVNFWYCFFCDYNIKIHFNSDEYPLSSVIKQIAINKLEGCSIGKCRSSPRKIQGDWYGYYPNDIFFTWGNDSTESIIKSKNYFKNLIISGYPYQEDKSQFNDILSIEKEFKRRGVQFSLLIIDGSHGKNEDSFHQLIPSKVMTKFINSFLEWILKDQELGIIIKSKKPGLLQMLPDLEKNLNLAKKTGRCKIFSELGLESKKFSNIVDFSIGISADIPSSVIQIAINGQKSIIYDFSNFKTLEKELYRWGENKVIFDNLETLITKLKNFKTYNEKNFGDWTNNIKYYDSFCDGKGGERIGDYVVDLKFYFDKGHSLNETILYASANYEKKWGKEMVRKLP